MRYRFGAEITWLAFDLHPEYPQEGIPRAELIARYGEAMNDRMRARFEQEGLAYNPPPDVVPNTRLAQQLTELARARGLGPRMHDRLMDAYWAEAVDIGDAEELRRSRPRSASTIRRRRGTIPSTSSASSPRRRRRTRSA